LAKCKVKEKEFMELAWIYNTEGRQAVYELLKSRYDIKNPYPVIRRMRAQTELCYDPGTDTFKLDMVQDQESVFMSMEELCAPVTSQHMVISGQGTDDDRPAAMEKLVHELIGDRLLELSRYVTIDSLSKRILVDKTTLMIDGYQLVIH